MSKEVNLVTFHPHAWGEKSAHKMNKKGGVPDAYHQVIIIRNAAAKAAQDYKRQFEREYVEPITPFGITSPREIEHEHDYDVATLTCTTCGKGQLNDL